MAAYDITLLDDFEFDTSFADAPDSAVIDEFHFATAYEGDSGDGFIKVMEVDSDDNSISTLFTYEHDTSQGENHKIELLDSNHLVLFYEGSSNTGKLKIFSIAGDYSLTEVTSITNSTDCAGALSLTVMSDTEFVIAYVDTSFSTGVIKYFSVNGSYAITEEDEAAPTQSFGSTKSKLLKLKTDFFILVYEGGSDGWMEMYEIVSDTITLRGSLEFDTSNGDYPSVAVLSDTTMMASCSGSGLDGFVYSITYSTSAPYTMTVIDSLEYDTIRANQQDIIKVDETHAFLAYENSSSKGIRKMFELDGSKTISTLSTVTFENTASNIEVHLATLAPSRIILAFAGASGDGFINLYEVEIPENDASNSNFLMFM